MSSGTKTMPARKSTAAVATSSVMSEAAAAPQRDPSDDERLKRFTENLMRMSQENRKASHANRIRRHIFKEAYRVPNLNMDPSQVFSPIRKMLP